MRKTSERQADTAIRQLLQTLTRNWYDTGVILDNYEASHNDYELCYSKEYNALNAAHFALKETIDKMNKQLNK
ncbi:MAG: hypothetical protein NC230_08910 [Bacteroides sp.]|nr:hypothetical protein [Bacteroides sp.]